MYLFLAHNRREREIEESQWHRRRNDDRRVAIWGVLFTSGRCRPFTFGVHDKYAKQQPLFIVMCFFFVWSNNVCVCFNYRMSVLCLLRLNTVSVQKVINEVRLVIAVRIYNSNYRLKFHSFVFEMHVIVSSYSERSNKEKISTPCGSPQRQRRQEKRRNVFELLLISDKAVGW